MFQSVVLRDLIKVAWLSVMMVLTRASSRVQVWVATSDSSLAAKLEKHLVVK